jgi:hypothetical protein
MRSAAAIALAALAAGCGGGGDKPAATPAPTATATATASAKPLSTEDAQLCAILFARLQRVTVALSSSSELIAQSTNQADLASRIQTEREQLERSARLMAGGTVPPALAGANRDLVAALHDFAADFARAEAPARRGDFQAAVAAMTDKPVVNRILAAAQTIQQRCNGG